MPKNQTETIDLNNVIAAYNTSCTNRHPQPYLRK